VIIMDDLHEQLVESTRNLICRLFECGRDEIIFFPLMTGSGGFFSKVICRSCYIDAAKSLHTTNGREEPTNCLVNLDKRGHVTDNSVYPSQWFQVYAGKCPNCGMITFGVRRKPAPERGKTNDC